MPTRKAREKMEVYPASGDQPRRLAEMSPAAQPRELLERHGPDGVEPDVLLALLLRTGFRGCNARDLARGLLERYGGLRGLARVTVDDLATVKGLGRVKAQIVVAACALARRHAEEPGERAPALTCPADVARLLRGIIAALDRERFWVLPLNAKNRLKLPRPELVSEGIQDACLVHPRDVFHKAIQLQAHAVVVAHNHPSGDPSPSAEDVRLTRQLVESGRVLGIRVLDHVVVARPRADTPEFVSLREAGLVAFDA